MKPLNCEICGKPVKAIRRQRKYGGRVTVLRDPHHTLCQRHHNSLWQSEMQKEKFREEKTING